MHSPILPEPLPDNPAQRQADGGELMARTEAGAVNISDAQVNSIMAQQDFADMVEKFQGDRSPALRIFSARVSRWSNAFTDVRLRRFAYTLGRCLDGDTHTGRIRQVKLCQRFKKDHGRTISPSQIKRYISVLETAGVIEVTRRIQDERGENPGMRKANEYEVRFWMVLRNGRVEAHDFLAQLKNDPKVDPKVDPKNGLYPVRTPVSKPVSVPVQHQQQDHADAASAANPSYPSEETSSEEPGATEPSLPSVEATEPGATEPGAGDLDSELDSEPGVASPPLAEVRGEDEDPGCPDHFELGTWVDGCEACIDDCTWTLDTQTLRKYAVDRPKLRECVADLGPGTIYGFHGTPAWYRLLDGIDGAKTSPVGWFMKVLKNEIRNPGIISWFLWGKKDGKPVYLEKTIEAGHRPWNEISGQEWIDEDEHRARLDELEADDPALVSDETTPEGWKAYLLTSDGNHIDDGVNERRIDDMTPGEREASLEMSWWDRFNFMRSIENRAAPEPEADAGLAELAAVAVEALKRRADREAGRKEAAAALDLAVAEALKPGTSTVTRVLVEIDDRNLWLSNEEQAELDRYPAGSRGRSSRLARYAENTETETVLVKKMVTCPACKKRAWNDGEHRCYVAALARIAARAEDPPVVLDGQE